MAKDLATSEQTKVSALRDTLAAVASAPENAPIAPPGRFYTDPDYFDFECATVLRTGWHAVCRSDELADTGAYLTLTLLDEPIIAVRTGDGVIALSNVCRHRGMPVAEGAGKTDRFVCPYHAWTYDLDGKLKRAARMQNAGFDPARCSLPRFACVERFGFVYVNLSDSPPDIDADLSGLAETIAPYEPSEYRIRHSATEIWRANWKSLVENFMEGYHLSVVHPQTLHDYTPTGLSRKGPAGIGFTSYYANYPDTAAPRGDGAPGLDAAAQRRSTLFAVFPTQVASIAATLLVAFSIRPLAADEIEVRWTLSTYGDELGEDTVADRIRLWEEVNREDREKLEAMQRALRSVHATGGPLAGPDYEGTVRDFLNWLAWRDNKA